MLFHFPYDKEKKTPTTLLPSPPLIYLFCFSLPNVPSGAEVKKGAKKSRKSGGLSGSSSDESNSEDSDKDEDTDDSFDSVSSGDDDEDDFNPFKDDSSEDEEDGKHLHADSLLMVLTRTVTIYFSVCV